MQISNRWLRRSAARPVARRGSCDANARPSVVEGSPWHSRSRSRIMIVTIVEPSESVTMTVTVTVIVALASNAITEQCQ